MSLKPTYIGNITLTTSLQAVTVPESVQISYLVMDTKDGTDFEIGLGSDSIRTFTFSNSRASSPFTFSYEREYETDSTTLFYVKGSAGSVYQYICFVK